MTMASRIAVGTPLYLSTEVGFGEAIEIWPLGVEANKVETIGVWDEDDLPGTNETQGDGRTLDDQDGRSDRKSVVIELATSHLGTNIQDPQSTSPDKLKRVADGTIVSAKRVIGADAELFSLLAVKHDHLTKKRGRRIG